MSFLFGVPGLVLQIAGRFVGDGDVLSGLPLLMSLVGTVLLIVGLGYYAKAKGRHLAWGLMGLLSIIGLIVLACLKDRSVSESVEV